MPKLVCRIQPRLTVFSRCGRKAILTGLPREPPAGRICIDVAWTQWSKPRLSQRGRLTGCQLFVKTNVPLANQGKPQLDLPPGYVQSAKPPVGAAFCIHPLSFILQPLLDGVFVSKRDIGRRGTLLRYRACTVVPPYQHRSNTLAGRWTHFRPHDRLRFHCRSQPPRCRGAPDDVIQTK